MKYVTPITYMGGPRDQEADVFDLGDGLPRDIQVQSPPGFYRVRRLVDTNRFVYLWVPREGPR